MGAAAYKLSVDGKPVDSVFAPILIKLEVQLSGDSGADILTITLDDTDGRVVLPAVGGTITCELGYADAGTAPVFNGVIDEAGSGGGSGDEEGDAAQHDRNHAMHGQRHVSGASSSGSRSSGRTLLISAKSADTTGKLKQPIEAHKDNASFEDAATEFGRQAGMSVQVASALASVQRAYWSIANESFWQWGARIAKDIGATFKIFGSQAVFVPRSGSVSASGQPLTGLRAVWGDNLLEWSIAPVLSRDAFNGFSTRYYDPHEAEWNSGQSSGATGVGSDTAAAAHVDRFKAPDQQQAEQRSSANEAESGRQVGGADYVVIVGDPAAQPQAPCTVAGVRDGIDGSYTVKEVLHSLSRGSGFLTQMSLVQPSGGAGTDDRGSDETSSDSTASSAPLGQGGIGSR